MQLENKIILVTGGSGLLGREIVRLLRERGATAVNLDVNQATDFSMDFVHCDITDNASISTAVEAIHSHYGRIDGLVNNAYPRTKDWGTDFENMTAESWRTNVDWQMNSYIFLCQKVLPIMVEQGCGSVVNMTSIYGVVANDLTMYEDTGVRTAPAYNAIKGGLINFSKYLASAYGKHGIRINCVSPGGIFDHQDPRFVTLYEHRVPLKRMGTPDDISPAVAFLLSDDARYITGHNLLVDGGWTAI
ncbi:MAG: hypothetical protein RL264_444 [Bacteroidota bacterium]|jgi:NAD(P)-dependent dehydrogenase (short-subunit alcohol dehydrogenase family)